ncbi:uncharacterized protein LOC142992192 [Genypterus blacodes]|uniref:uncharacterized protein LOC142992192 n=1 Tax=Genypterus blacodes TaxID=154954 RepID=UPI003F7581E2
MEPISSQETAGTGSMLAVPLSPSVHVIPTLRDVELYHVFISYSSTDYQWTHSLISQLESCGLQICYHERDFIPGRTVLENMSDCIQQSQKVLLVLSPEFVRSRWCLLEANMSLFRDCLERKPIVPVLLEPGVSVPLHLCHLTYLDAKDPDFLNKLLKVLCTPNQKLRGSTVAPFQPPSIYNGKVLQPLTAINEEDLIADGINSCDAGTFTDMEIPDQLRLVIEDKEKYRRAVRMINDVSQNKLWPHPPWLRLLLLIIVVVLFLLISMIPVSYTIPLFTQNNKVIPPDLLAFSTSIFACIPIVAFIHCCQLVFDLKKYIVREMQKAMCQANMILSEEKVLMGCQSNSKIYLVYVSLDSCRHEFAVTFSEQNLAEEMFQRALLYFSSGYACCLAKKHFPFPVPSSSRHLEGGVCFCQYVSEQLKREKWI